MRHLLLHRYTSLILCGLAATAGGVSHATEVTDAAAPFSALGTLRIQVIINPFLRLRIGNNNATINLLQFSPAAGVVGNSSSIVGAGGDVAASTVTVAVQGNRNQITITPTNSSGNMYLLIN